MIVGLAIVGIVWLVVLVCAAVVLNDDPGDDDGHWDRWL